MSEAFTFGADTGCTGAAGNAHPLVCDGSFTICTKSTSSPQKVHAFFNMNTTFSSHYKDMAEKRGDCLNVSPTDVWRLLDCKPWQHDLVLLHSRHERFLHRCVYCWCFIVNEWNGLLLLFALCSYRKETLCYFLVSPVCKWTWCVNEELTPAALCLHRGLWGADSRRAGEGRLGVWAARASRCHRAAL